MIEWRPFREPLRETLTRTVGLAVVIGAVVASRAGGFARWPALSVVFLWLTAGGHYLELLFLNWIRPRIPRVGLIQRVTRLALWFVGGVLLALGMRLTAQALGVLVAPVWLTWPVAGILFV